MTRAQSELHMGPSGPCNSPRLSTGPIGQWPHGQAQRVGDSIAIDRTVDKVVVTTWQRDYSIARTGDPLRFQLGL